MASGKSSFVLYTSYVHSVDLLTNEQAGKLLKHILNYVNDFDPVEEDPIVRIAFEPIKQQLKRDLKEWRSEKKKRSAAGKKGMETRWKKPITNDNSVIKPITAITVDVNDNVFVNVNENVERSIYIKPDENYELDLPEMNINSVIEYLSLTKKIKADRHLVLSLWAIFKQKHFTGEKPYKSKAKIYSHFLETLKFEKINGTHQQTFKSSSKSTGAEQLLTSLKEDLGA